MLLRSSRPGNKPPSGVSARVSARQFQKYTSPSSPPASLRTGLAKTHIHRPFYKSLQRTLILFKLLGNVAQPVSLPSLSLLLSPGSGHHRSVVGTISACSYSILSLSGSLTSAIASLRPAAHLSSPSLSNSASSSSNRLSATAVSSTVPEASLRGPIQTPCSSHGM